MQQNLDFVEGTHQALLTQAAADNMEYHLAAHAACTALGQALAIAYVAPHMASMASNAAGRAFAYTTTAAIGSEVGSRAYHLGKTLSELCWTERVAGQAQQEHIHS